MDRSQQKRLSSSTDEDEYVEFFRAGARVKGVFECVSCGAGRVAVGPLPPCGSCGERIWERGVWAPFQAVR